MLLLTDYNVLIESLQTYRSECVLAHLQSGSFFASDITSLFQGEEARIDRNIKRHLSAPCMFPSLHSVIPPYAPSTALTVCRDSIAGVYHDLETGKCISRISRGVYSSRMAEGVPDLGGTCTHLTAAADSSSPLVFLSSALGDINVIDLRVGVKGEFGHPVMCLSRCHAGAISCMYNFRTFNFSLISGGFEDGKLNFYDLRFPYDHVKSSFSDRPLTLRSLEVHLRNQTKYVDMDETDQQILKHMKLGRITGLAVSHDERLLAVSNAQSELAVCTTHEDVRIMKMGFLSSKDDYATSLAFGKKDMTLYCVTYDLLAGIARCKRYMEHDKDATPDGDEPAQPEENISPYPYNFVSWPMLNFQSNNWATTPVERFTYGDGFQLIEDKHSSCVFGDEDSAATKHAKQNKATPTMNGNVGDDISPMDWLSLTKGSVAESKHRSFRDHSPGRLDPLIFTLHGDYAISTGGCEASVATVDVWDPTTRKLISSSSTPETRGVRFEHICSGDSGVVLLSGSFERSVDTAENVSDKQLNKCVCVMKPVPSDSLVSDGESASLHCSTI
ncbi:WD-40 repeat protein, putative [Babesia ovis]|uniref:WD-40 repeat protein, putative n=1 Tax=Babesia ovis TaxID=5869 RepID=A0A9W5WTN0_BABOV|nr:WD-40 repeat protein, putative [Babesia ovis]